MPKISNRRRWLAGTALTALVLAGPGATAASAAPQQSPAAATDGAAAGHSAATTVGGRAPASAPSRPPAPKQHPVRRACNQTPRPGRMLCASVIRTDVVGRKGVQPAASAPYGYGPGDLQSAYSLPSANSGAGQTVAIVDAYDDPNAEADLATYRAQYGLSPCTTANGCFRKVAQDGTSTYPVPDSQWAGEISLDLDMVSAACPACHILLVEATDNMPDNLGASVDEAVALGAKYVSNSYAGGEDYTETSYDKYFNHPGVVVTASTGDWGYGVYYPAASPYVTAVGGTTLQPDSSTGRGWSEAAWAGAGSGCSTIEPKPAWQVDTGCANRAVGDVAAVADPNTGVAVYDTYQNGGWAVFGGTSVSAPLVAAAYALAGTPQPGSYPAQYPYDASITGAGGLNDVTAGSNANGCTPAYLCTGAPGYDGPTGLGTPTGTTALSYRAHGTVSGTVTDSATGKPVGGARVAARPYASTTTVTDSSGAYQLSLPAGTWTLTTTDYGYDTATTTLTLTADTTTTHDIALTGTPHQTVSGTVTAAPGQPWPLYAKVSWSDGAGHSGTTFTTPATGQYSLSLLQNANYTLQVTPLYPGYHVASTQLSVAAADITHNVALDVDLLACTAIGYQSTYHGSTESFDTNAIPDGWQLANTELHLPGYTNQPGWVFNNPAGRANNTGGSNGFAIVDSDYDGAHHYQDTTLTSAAADLSGYTSPVLQFNTDLRPAVNSHATAQVSTDGGRTWTTMWEQAAFPGAPGPQTVVVPLPDAAGKAHVQARFHYTGEWSQYWEIDNVFLGNRACTTVTGGLLLGRVTDAANGQALTGATVTSTANPADHATTVATPGDDAIGGGIYWMLATATGNQQFTATMNGYTPQTQTTTITDGQTTVLDFPLTQANNSTGGSTTAH